MSSQRWHEIASSPEFARVQALRRRVTFGTLGVFAVVSIPIGFLGCLIGTLLGGREQKALDTFEEVLVRSETGRGAEVGGGRSERGATGSAKQQPVAAQ